MLTEKNVMIDIYVSQGDLGLRARQASQSTNHMYLYKKLKRKLIECKVSGV